MTNAIIPYADHPLWLVAGTDAVRRKCVRGSTTKIEVEPK